MQLSEIVKSPDYVRFCEGRLVDPYPFFQVLREHDPVHWSEQLSAWVLTRYDDVAAAHREPAFASARASLNMGPLPAGLREKVAPLGEHVANWLGFTDPPKHTRLRKLVAKSMSPRFIAGLAPRIQEIIDDLLARVDGQQVMDLFHDFSYPLPATVGCELLGIPTADRDECKRHIGDLVSFVGSVGPALVDAAGPAYDSYKALAEYFCSLAEQRRRRPTDDMFTALVTGMDGGDVLDATELVGLSVFLYVAGHETTVGLLINGLLALMQHPGELERLQNDWSLVDSTIEECLRYESPIQIDTRLVVKDVEIRGQKIREGDAIVLMLAAANRDPGQFPDPDRFDITRKDNRHLAFGYGIHFCLGAPLARLEARLALPTILKRFPAMRLRDDKLDWRESMVLRAVTNLPVVLGSTE